MKITFTGEKGRNVRRRISRPAALQTATTVAALKCTEVEYWLHQHHKSSTLVPENNATKQTKSFLLSYCMLLILSCFGDAQSTGCRDIFSPNRIKTGRVKIIQSISYVFKPLMVIAQQTIFPLGILIVFYASGVELIRFWPVV